MLSLGKTCTSLAIYIYIYINIEDMHSSHYLVCTYEGQGINLLLMNFQML